MAAREAPARAGPAPAWRADPDKPWFHVMPRDGWLNDPNGPLFHHDRYHVFYQHVVGSSEWAWACSWAHASSADLVAWRHEPIALQPSPGALDAAGCWSGTVAVSDEGKPTMLYTAVRLRSDPRSEPLPPPGHDIGLDMIECQCCATCPADDTSLIRWAKAEEPIIQYPPGGMALEGFRDPYVIQQGGLEQPWRIILGSGIKGGGGTLLVYESQHLTHGWNYQGELTSGTSRPCGTCDLGAMWECPFFLRLSESLPGQPAAPAADPNSSCALQNSEASTGTHVLCVSPYPHHVEGRPTNPCLYWLGPYQAAKFDLEAAAGPFQLDLGDILYAPNTLSCPDGRMLLLAWLQELRSCGGFNYAGCLSIPRLITLQGGRLHQEPAAEVAQLRMAPSWRVASLDVTPMAGAHIPDVAGPSCDVTFVLEPHGCRRAGLLIRAWLQPGPNTSDQPAAAAVVVDWEEAQLQVLYPTLLHTQSCTFDWGQLARSVGGSIDMKSDKHVQLRILIDHSAVEVFASSGEALATRVYRGDMPASKDPGMFFVAEGGPVHVRDVEAYTMRSIWEDPGDRPAKDHEPAAE